MKNERITGKNVLFAVIGILFILATGWLCKFVWSKQEKPEIKPVMVEIVVRKGCCLSQIAFDLGTDCQEMARINNLADPNKIYPGQILKAFPFNKNKVAKVSWYGERFQGKPMANRKLFDMNDPTIAAHKWLPLGKKVRLVCIETKKTTILTVQDRGPYVSSDPKRKFDISYGGAQKLGIVEIGVARCRVEILSE